MQTIGLGVLNWSLNVYSQSFSRRKAGLGWDICTDRMTGTHDWKHYHLTTGGDNHWQIMEHQGHTTLKLQMQSVKILFYHLTRAKLFKNIITAISVIMIGCHPFTTRVTASVSWPHFHGISGAHHTARSVFIQPGITDWNVYVISTRYPDWKVI